METQGDAHKLLFFDKCIEKKPTAKKRTAGKYVTDWVLAESLSLSVWTIRKWRQQRRIPSYKFGRSVRYVTEEVVQAISGNGVSDAK